MHATVFTCSTSSLPTTIPWPSVHAPPISARMRAWQLPSGSEDPSSAVATYGVMPFGQISQTQGATGEWAMCARGTGNGEGVFGIVLFKLALEEFPWKSFMGPCSTTPAAPCRCT